VQSLGTIALTGVDSVAPTVITFGICFRTAGGTAGMLSNSGTVSAKFRHVGLPG
jgi:hypothetical protein